jgi:hypothetical protein
MRSRIFFSHQHLQQLPGWLDYTIKIQSLLPAIALSTDKFIAFYNVGGELISILIAANYANTPSDCHDLSVIAYESNCSLRFTVFPSLP